MGIMTIIGLLLIAAFLSILLRKNYPEFSLFVGLAAGVGAIGLIIAKVVPLITSIGTLLESSSLPAEYGTILFKALGICLLTQMAADTCRDAGETALATKAEMAGKVFLLALSLPLLESITKLAASLIGK